MSTVSRHWPTNLVLDEVDLAGIVHEDLPVLLSGTGGGSMEVIENKRALADEVALRARLTASMQALAVADSRPQPDEIHLEVQLWRGGYDLPATASPADYVAWCVLAATSSNHEQSGAIAVADPRAGCALVPMPGLPWGRSAMIAAKVGAHLAAPGWLTHFVIPVEKDQAVIVAVAFSI
ncbi:hypothetical protein OG339_45635 [Streptosporangium sp. NBC_01495]|uniref:hypothetical protein n=1 Tax=Streptosporangium sp. NBC_01495 TaxID=2903899 RepID=UPI002E33CD69|nr:hypothetical protein [Streptosporangium sp. NBC_01495]